MRLQTLQSDTAQRHAAACIKHPQLPRTGAYHKGAALRKNQVCGFIAHHKGIHDGVGLQADHAH